MEVSDLISLGIAAAIGAAVGAVALGAASAATHGDIPGLAIALQHIPPLPPSPRARTARLLPRSSRGPPHLLLFPLILSDPI